MKPIKLELRTLREKHTNFKSWWHERHPAFDQGLYDRPTPDSVNKLPVLEPTGVRALILTMDRHNTLNDVQRQIILRIRRKEIQEA